MREVLIKTLGKEISLHQVCWEKRYDGYSGLKAQSEKSPGENVSTSRISLPLADKNNIKIVLNNNEIKLTKFSWRKFRSLRERLRSYLNRSNIWFELRSICFHHSLWVTDNWPIVMPHSFPFVDEWALLPFSHLPSRVSCLSVLRGCHANMLEIVSVQDKEFSQDFFLMCMSEGKLWKKIEIKVRT